MKRKLLALFTALLLLAVMVTPAFADVIWEPDNSFYERHRTECVYHDRGYLANGEAGYVTVFTAPGSSSELINISNGTRFYVSFLWTDEDGTRWGVGYPAGQGDKEGWVDLSEMAMIYDYICFNEDHSSEFEEYDGSGDHLTEACVYTYPGGVYSSRMEQGSGSYSFTDGFRNLYTDENGLRWTFIGYYMGHRDGWVCIDDPVNENLGVESALSVAQVRGEAEGLHPSVDEVPAAMTFPLWLIPVILVIAVAVVTAVIVRRRRMK